MSEPAGDRVGWIPARSASQGACPDLSHPDIPSEERYLGRLYDRLGELIAHTRDQLVRANAQVGGTPQARSERESYIRLYTGELATYRAANMGLCFGRLDTTDGATNYIGRVGLRDTDPDMSPLLLDWRSELSRPFYLATTARPEGIRRRRHIRAAGRRITGLHDEYLDAPEATADTESADVAGEAALLAALNKARTGHMEDVVSTIQREQDLIIRNAHRGVVVVQGGPGTGKTAVALHRAAYLLYTFREQLDRSGVLIIGPNSTFLDYIARVLPSLGESGVVLRTIGTMYPGIDARGTESERATEVKGSAEMLAILAAAVKAYQDAPTDSSFITVDGVRLEITPAMVRKARGRGRMSRRPHNRARPTFVEVLVDQLTDAYAEQVGTALQVPGGAAEQAAREAALWQDPDFTDGEAAPDSVEVFASGGQVTPIDSGSPVAAEKNLLTSEDLASVRHELSGSDELEQLVDAWWPILSPERVLAELLSDRERIAAAAAQYVEEDQEALYRPDGEAFSPADVPLLDELAEILGLDPEADRAEEERAWAEQLRQAEEALEILQGSASQDIEDELDPEILAAYDVVDAEMLARRHQADSDLTVAERAAADRQWAFGHVIVDEAQELSPMAWRMVMRRSPNRWMTLVGDTAQTSSPAGVDSWDEALSPYVEDRWQLCELTINYRTPATITAVADEVLAAVSPELQPPRPIRAGEHPVGWHSMTTEAAASPADAPGSATAEWMTETIVDILRGLPRDRSTAVVSDPQTLDSLPDADELAARAGLAAAADDERTPVTVLDVAEAKGLEFDHVLVVEPAAVAEASVQGLQDLYVALTRATQQLHVVYSRRLPGALENARSAVVK